jgi:ABC-type multidrug transport system fused ATPase/permease subunit
VKLWWLRLLRYAMPQWKSVSLSILLMILAVILDVLKPWPLKLVVDSILAGKPLPPMAAWLYELPGGHSPSALLAWLVAATIVVFLFLWAREMVQSYVQAGAGSRMVYDLGADLFHHLQHLSLRFHGRNSIGDLVRRITANTGCVRDLVFAVFIPMFSALLSLVMMFGIMWRLNRSLALLALLAAPVLGLLVRRFGQLMEERMYRQLQLEGKLSDLAEQTLSALPIVRAFGRENSLDIRFSDLCRETGRAYVRTVNAQIQFKIGASAVTAAGTALLLAIGGLQVMRGSLSLGSLLVFLSYLTSLYTPMETLAYLSAGFAAAGAGARRIFETLDVDDRVPEPSHPKTLLAPPDRGAHVRLEGVTFGYETGRPVLLNVNLDAQPGQTVALVGPTGAGKSTLVSLLPRFFDPWEGRVTIEGTDVRELRLANLREQIAFVLQEPFLLPATVADNIAYGCPGADREQIVAAAVAANADEFIRRLPQGFDTIIGQRGATLSLGQRQRLSIARALLKNSPILILDEPTSALDAETETLLLNALERLLEGRTSFVIAHRLSTIQRAHRIVVLDEGRIVEQGTHQELSRSGGLYSRFAAFQLCESKAAATSA